MTPPVHPLKVQIHMSTPDTYYVTGDSMEIAGEHMDGSYGIGWNKRVGFYIPIPQRKLNWLVSCMENDGYCVEMMDPFAA